MAHKSEAQKKHELLLSKVPPNAKYVYVKTDKGEKKYRLLVEVAVGDEILTNKAGAPITMKGAPGRPKTVVLAPSNPVVAAVVQGKQKALDSDAILSAVRTNPNGPAVLQEIVLALGEEAASLGFERQEAEREGKETSSISVRRVNTLRALADTWLKKLDQTGSKSVDPKSPSFQAAIQFVVETFRDVLTLVGERPEMIETVFSRLAQTMDDDWELELRSRMKNSN